MAGMKRVWSSLVSIRSSGGHLKGGKGNRLDRLFPAVQDRSRRASFIGWRRARRRTPQHGPIPAVRLPFQPAEPFKRYQRQGSQLLSGE